MKKYILVLISFLIICFETFSQESLWEGQKIISPEVHSDNTVTFRLEAPKAESVQVKGDFLPDKINSGIADMTKNKNGLWEYTTEPLDPEFYSYSFLVDGLKINDPNNLFLNRDITSLHNVFLIGGSRADLYKVNNVPHGSVIRCWYSSPTLQMTRRLVIYTPPSYESSNTDYPVLYLLHGMGGDEETWTERGRMAQIMDNLIAQGKAKPMIVVMPNGNASQEAAPGESSLGFYKPETKLPKIDAKSVFSDMSEAKKILPLLKESNQIIKSFPDIVNFIDQRFRTKKEKSGRAIAGLSMGGFQSMYISKEYPDMFDYVGLFSAAALAPNVNVPPFDNVTEKLKVQFDKKPALYWMAVGKEDFLYKMNENYRRKLDENGHKYTYFETGEGHIWKNWRIYLTEFVPLLF